MRRDARHPKWGTVSGAFERALIVACGPSAATANPSELSPAPGLAIIAVNAAGRSMAHATHWATMDPSQTNREIMARPEPGRISYVSVYDHFEPTEIEERHVTFLRYLKGNGVGGTHFGFSDDPSMLAVGNSTYAAMNVAWLLGCKRIAILGLDGTLDPYWCARGQPRGSFKHFPELFASVLPQLEARGVEVRNGSPKSLVDCFPRVDPVEAVRWAYE